MANDAIAHRPCVYVVPAVQNRSCEGRDLFQVRRGTTQRSRKVSAEIGELNSIRTRRCGGACEVATTAAGWRYSTGTPRPGYRPALRITYFH
jgi:hypothetical protein